MASIVDVAREAGVSPATVSRTFTSPDLLSAETQERVLAAARVLNYNPKPRRLGTANVKIAGPHAIGFQFFSVDLQDTVATNPFYAAVLAGAQAEAAALGLHLLLHTTDRRGLSAETPKMLADRAVSGMLLVGTADWDVLDVFARHMSHIVLVDNRDVTGRWESVVSDGFSGAYQATSHLVQRGHSRIGFISTDRRIATFQDRLHGVQAALLDNGCVPHPEFAVSGESFTETEALLKDMLSSATRPSAVVAANDYHALIVMKVCRSLGLSVPGDVSLVGFDDVDFAAHVHPQLTTIRVDRALIGRLAVRRLYSRLVRDGHNPDELGVCTVVPVSLVHRQSCCSAENLAQ